jgi:uncharacterized protein
MVESIGESLRRRRIEVVLTQRELAARSGVPQPNIAAYETGRRTPSAETVARIEAALTEPTMRRLRLLKGPIEEIAAARRLESVRVFGSVARGDSGPGSDVDLLVHPLAEASVFDLAAFMSEVSELLGASVMDRIRAEAVAL